MNISNLLENSNLMVIQAVDNLNEVDWEIPGVCGEWSVKDIIAHLASYERVVVDVLNTFLGSTPTAYSMRWINQPAEFNKAEVEARKYHTAQHVEDEYQDLQVQATSLLAQIPEETISKTGTMPWYKQDCCLADFINMVYEHTCEHCDQIVAFRKKARGGMERGV